MVPHFERLPDFIGCESVEHVPVLPAQVEVKLVVELSDCDEPLLEWEDWLEENSLVPVLLFVPLVDPLLLDVNAELLPMEDSRPEDDPGAEDVRDVSLASELPPDSLDTGELDSSVEISLIDESVDPALVSDVSEVRDVSADDVDAVAVVKVTSPPPSFLTSQRSS